MTTTSANTARRVSRKRVRTSLLTVICVTLCRSSDAFLSSTQRPSHLVAPSISSTMRIRRQETAAPSLSAVSSELLMMKIDDNNSNNRDLQTQRLSHEEQKELLLQAVELRRIKQIESEMRMSSVHKKTGTVSVTALQISRAAGYGDELLEFEEAVAAGESARERLVTTNMGLVHYCVRDILQKRARLQAVTREDLLQEGAIGLARAVDRWNPAIGGKFSTYAVYWIRAAVLRCIAERDDLVRVPEHVTAALGKLRRAAAVLNLELDDKASWREAAQAKALAEQAGISDRQMAEAMKVRDRRNVGVLSFESWMQQGRDLETDVVSSPTEEWSKSESSSVDTEQIKQTLSRFLRPREMEALSLRYGLNQGSSSASSGTAKRDYVAEAEAELFGEGGSSSNASPRKALARGGKWGEAMSFVEVGQHMKVSAEYGRRLCHAALDKLRRAAEDGALEPALLF